MGDAKMRPQFSDLHRVTLDPDTTPDTMAHALRRADGLAERRRLSEGAVYVAALRRYTMLTGLDWRDAQQPDDADAWGGQSDHRLRIREQPGAAWMVWGCSCGVTDTAEDRESAVAAHQAHVEQAGAA